MLWGNGAGAGKVADRKGATRGALVAGRVALRAILSARWRCDDRYPDLMVRKEKARLLN